MNCPIDNTEMTQTKREGITIDYCPQCRGVWLDRGELDKIIERSEIDAAGSAGTDKPDYPEIKEGRIGNKEKSYQSPGSFFGRIFET
jgi:uncharacterized protein